MSVRRANAPAQDAWSWRTSCRRTSNYVADGLGHGGIARVLWQRMGGGVTESSFDSWFANATNNPPLPYQRELAIAKKLYRLVRVPTGLGKTQAILAAWLWRRRYADDATRSATPRRLVYCLPMRVLVEQTRDVAASLLKCAGLGAEVRVHVLMGGEDADDWDTHPEADAILVGTQDMLLSRALNRGYAMNRYRWPIHFALLNEDCLWVVDEPQLFGAGLPTTAQLAAFRRRFGTHAPSATIWASATLDPSWLRTVDVQPEVDCAPELALGEDDARHPVVRQRLRAKKDVLRADVTVGDAKGLASLILREHRAGTRTIVVVNTVKRARELYALLRASGRGEPMAKTSKRRKKGDPVVVVPEVVDRAQAVIVHSRFRPDDRKARVIEALAPLGPQGTIVVATQVIEAGVDVSCTTLITELAPWTSVVQRLGRCNRRGEDADARVFWCPLPSKPKERKSAALPYDLAEMDRAETALETVRDGSPGALTELGVTLGERPPTQVVRAKDIIELFDTTPDLSGADVDVSRFIRDGDERDVHVFWRAFETPGEQAAPRRAELCAAPIGELQDLLKTSRRRAWRWDLSERRWIHADRLVPGMELLLHSDTGGYSPDRGWDPAASGAVSAIDRIGPDEGTSAADRSDDDDPLSRRQCLSLTQHSTDTAREAETLVAALASALPPELRATIVRAARWHDVGKAHHVFQDTLRRSGCAEAAGLLAKSPGNARHSRPGFRHELASALAALAHGEPDLIAYLLAAHHGKVRLRIRSQPMEARPPQDDRLFARGVWDGDELGEVDLGNGERVAPTVLCLDYMRLGGSERVGASWTARMTALRDDPSIGPFRLAFLETLVRVADERASGNPGSNE